MRDLVTVVDAMLVHVPERSVQFRRALESAKTSDEYLAPEELIGEHWKGAAIVLSQNIPANPAHRQPWQQEVMRIWIG